MNYFFFSLHAILTIIVENRLQSDVLRDRLSNYDGHVLTY